jgi:hypothetical protein
MAAVGQFPPALGRRLGNRLPMGLVVTAALASVLALGFDLSSIASIGSAIALLVFALVTIGHFGLRAETGANVWVLCASVLSTVAVLATFVLTTLIHEPKTLIAMAVIMLVSIALDVIWKRDPRSSSGRALEQAAASREPTV